MSRYRIINADGGFDIFDEVIGEAIAGPYATTDEAEEAIHGIEEDEEDDQLRYEYETQPPLSDREQAEEYYREEAANEEMNEAREDSE